MLIREMVTERRLTRKPDWKLLSILRKWCLRGHRIRKIHKGGKLRIMAAGKFASLPRNMVVNHQFPLASSMDLLSSKSPLAEHRPDAYHDVSIHGTLPRKKKGPPPIRSCDNASHMGTLPHSKSPRQSSPLTQDVIQENPLQDWKGETFTF
ncbi:hypothetical protein STEG23_004424, partial [Scotinomys teguina]